MLGNILTGWCDSSLNILPAPQKIVMGEGTFVVKKGLAIVSTDANDFSANFLQDKLEEVFDFPITLTRQSVNEGFMRLNVASPRSVLEQAMKQLADAYVSL